MILESLGDMKRAVEDFAANLDEESIRKMCRHTKKRDVACVSAGGSRVFTWLFSTP